MFKLAQAVAEGAGSVEGVTVRLARIPETLSDEVLGKMHALEAKVSFPSLPTPSHLHRHQHF
jgi:NAD(P)H dehydrogenase (quinone)